MEDANKNFAVNQQNDSDRFEVLTERNRVFQKSVPYTLPCSVTEVVKIARKSSILNHYTTAVTPLYDWLLVDPIDFDSFTQIP